MCDSRFFYASITFPGVRMSFGSMARLMVFMIFS